MTVALRYRVRCIVEPATSAGPTVQLESVVGGSARLANTLPDLPPEGQNQFQPGDVLFSKLRPYLAKSLLVDQPLQGTGEFLCLRPSAELDPRYLKHVTLSRTWLEHAGMGSYGMKMPRTSWEQMATFRLPSMPVIEQRRIADFLDDRVCRIDRIIAARQEQLAAQEEAFDSWWAAEFDSLAEDYPMAPIRRLLESIVDGPFGSSLTSQHYVDEGTRVIRLGNIGKATFRDDDRAYISNEYGMELASHAAVPGDLVMAGLGDDKWPLGRCTVVPDIGPAIVKADCYRLRFDPTISHHFAAIMLTSPSARARFSLMARGSTRARLNTAVAREALLPLVPMDVQMDAVRQWEERHSEVDRLRGGMLRSINLLTEYKTSLITAAVTGELDVTTAGSNIPG